MRLILIAYFLYKRGDKVEQIISNLGFPIASVVGLAYYFVQKDKSSREDINKIISLLFMKSIIQSAIISPISPIDKSSSFVVTKNFSSVLNFLAISLAVLMPTLGIPIAYIKDASSIFLLFARLRISFTLSK